jgi:hypothetical protein
MSDRGYLTRQAAWLLKFAKSTKDPELSGVLIGKAADLRARAEENAPLRDPSPKPPDVQDFP